MYDKVDPHHENIYKLEINCQYLTMIRPQECNFYERNTGELYNLDPCKFVDVVTCTVLPGGVTLPICAVIKLEWAVIKSKYWN